MKPPATSPSHKVQKATSVLLHIALIVLIIFASSYILLGSAPPALTSPIRCLSYEPRGNQNTLTQEDPVSEVQIRSDLLIAKKYTNCIRTYTTSFGMDRVPKLAAELGIEVVVGVWLDKDFDRNEREIQFLRKIFTEKPHNIKFVIVGNESLFFKLVKPNKLVRYLKTVQKFSPAPISTAEHRALWKKLPKIIEQIDFIALHTFPYWEGISNNSTLVAAFKPQLEIKRQFPNKPVYILESGWPSDGFPYGDARVGLKEQREFLNKFLRQANASGEFYNIIELFDHPWKMHLDEGRSGAHWGILDAQGDDKWKKEVEWHLNLALISSIITIIFALLFSYKFRKFHLKAHLLTHWYIAGLSCILVWTILCLSKEYMLWHLSSWIYILPTELLIVASTLIAFSYIIRIIGADPRVAARPEGVENNNNQNQFVSLHIVCCNEPPELVINCIKSCLALNYQNFEVIVVDNNTADIALWHPLKVFCETNDRVHFYHEDKLAGFKAGALNYALARTSARATIIGVVDSDYIVQSVWLQKTVPLLKDTTKVVQAPQAYRFFSGTMIERAAMFEQSFIANITMRVRSASNSIVQHGTMCLIDRTALEEVGTWAEWCICEDTELGLRILESGAKIVFIPEVLGHGVSPQNFEQFAIQKFRWVYGAVRITLAHWRELFGFNKKLTFSQRINYLAGWLPWYTHFLYPILTLSIYWRTYILIYNGRLFPPLGLSFVPILLFIFQILFIVASCRMLRLGKVRDIFLLIGLGASVCSVIFDAILAGFVFSKVPFRVTSKKPPPPQWQFLTNLKESSVSILILLGIAYWIYCLVDIYSAFCLEAVLWSSLLIVVAIPQIANLIFRFAGDKIIMDSESSSSRA